jgi:hypothetical protein
MPSGPTKIIVSICIHWVMGCRDLTGVVDEDAEIGIPMRIFSRIVVGTAALIWFVLVSFVVANPLTLLDVAEADLDRLYGVMMFWPPLGLITLIAAAVLAWRGRAGLALALVVFAPMVWAAFFLPKVYTSENQQYLIDCGDYLERNPQH